MEDHNQKKKLEDGLSQNDGDKLKLKGPYRQEKSLEEIEKKMNGSSSKESCKASDDMPRAAAAAAADDDDDQKPSAAEAASASASASAIRECDFCHKKFTSGKALGGHRRFHLQAQRKEGIVNGNGNGQFQNNNPIKTNKKVNNCDEACDGKPIACRICNKEFPSNKSLFGHMRSHPGRDWKGVEPPTPSHPSLPPSDHHHHHLPHNHNHTSCSSPYFDDSIIHEQNQKVAVGNCFGTIVAGAAAAAATVTASSNNIEPVIDLSRCLSSSWEKTNKRGRKSILDLDLDLDPIDVEAAETLIELSRDRRGCFSASEFLESLSSPSPQDDHNLNENGPDAVVVVEAKSTTPGIIVPSSPAKKRKTDEELSTRKQKSPKKIKFLMRGSFTSMELEMDDGKVSVNMDVEEKQEEEANLTKELEDCAKNMKGSSVGNMNAEETPSGLQDDDDDGTTVTKKEKKEKKKKKNKKRKKSLMKLKSQDSESEEPIRTLKTPNGYRCSVCGKSFSTFQALGGHMSSHNKEKNNISGMDEPRTPLAASAEDQHNHNLQMNENKEVEVMRGPLVEANDHHEELALAPADEATLSRTAQEKEDASQPVPKTLGFDLNVPYVMKDDEVEEN